MNPITFDKENENQLDEYANNQIGFVTIRQTADVLRAGLLKSRFDSENMQYTSFGEVSMNRTLMTGGVSVRVCVAEHEFARAREVLEALLENQTGEKSVPANCKPL